jgi:3-deoxy-D-manno-octulosonate 8-phosphate phosphatase (KDO 8-P phosphatase)
VVRALILDVDGVLTDGGVILDGDGGEVKRFHARDGVGVKLALTAGWRVLFLTARNSPPARRRAAELGAEWAIGVADKARFLEAWLAEAGIDWAETAYVGDDLQDLGALRRAGFPIAVADAVAEVRAAARLVTDLPGGSGAVREAVETLLDLQGIREETVRAFLGRVEGFSVGKEERGGAPS